MSEKRKLPINLLRKAVRERRNRNELKRRVCKQKPVDAKSLEIDALIRDTEAEIQKILSETELLCDIPDDCTPEELLAEIALAEGTATTIYVQRDGLSTLTVVLPQENPNIAQLKRAIETTARVQLKRELKQRHEERLKRRGEHATTSKEYQQKQQQQQQQQLPLLEQQIHAIRNTGELVHSTIRNGHQHRSNVSWRFLWRAYALYDIERNKPINDTDGRKLLSECGIENAMTLKFCARVKYFGRKRQKQNQKFRKN